MKFFRDDFKKILPNSLKNDLDIFSLELNGYGALRCIYFNLTYKHHRELTINGYENNKTFVNEFYRYILAKNENRSEHMLFKILDKETSRKDLESMADFEFMIKLLDEGSTVELSLLKIRLKAEGIDFPEDGITLLENIK